MEQPRTRSKRQLYKILVIDDDPSGTELLITLLGLEGFQGSRLENWADPLADVERQSPDLVIMDVYLSDRDGVELLRDIRAHSELRIANTPVLMMSAENLETRCLSAGANGFVEKPFELGKLIATIREIVEVGLLEN
jgi:DNA-binding response OmpR family regulator